MKTGWARMGAAPDDKTPMIVIRNLVKQFGQVDAVNGVSLQVEQGKVLVIIGPSGSGKSTVLRCINHLEVPTSGEIWVDGIRLTHNHKDINAIRAEVGMVFQQFNLFPHLTALENIMLAQKVVRKRNRDESERVARRQLERVGIPEKADNYPGQLSGGQQQRVAIARALVNRPMVLLADEPTGNLDSKNAEVIYTLFSRLNEETGQTIVLVTHDDHFAGETRRILHILDGRLESDRKLR